VAVSGALFDLGVVQGPLDAVDVGRGIAVIAFMWFVIPWIMNGRPNIAGELPLQSPRELH